MGSIGPSEPARVRLFCATAGNLPALLQMLTASKDPLAAVTFAAVNVLRSINVGQTLYDETAVSPSRKVNEAAAPFACYCGQREGLGIHHITTVSFSAAREIPV